jgi:phage-related protein
MRTPAAAGASALAARELRLIVLVEIVFSSEITYRYALADTDITYNGALWYKTRGGFTDIQESTQREAPTLRLLLQNIDGTLGALVDGIRSGADLRRKRITIHEVEASVVGTANAGISTTFVVEDYRITGDAVALSIGTAMAVTIKVPSRTTQPYTCDWRYGSQECGVIPGVTSAFTTCARTLADCRARNPSTVPFGGFPSVTAKGSLRL